MLTVVGKKVPAKTLEDAKPIIKLSLMVFRWIPKPLENLWVVKLKMRLGISYPYLIHNHYVFGFSLYARIELKVTICPAVVLAGIYYLPIIF